MEKMVAIPLMVPKSMKRKLYALKAKGLAKGFTINGYIRALLEKDLNPPKKKGV